MTSLHLSPPHDWAVLLLLVLVGAVASGINSVAGGGSLISFPTLIGLGSIFGQPSLNIPSKPANATNSVGLWPGSLSGAFGFKDALPKTRHYIKTLWLPTLLGSVTGALLLILTGQQVFDTIVPALLLLATALLFFQKNVKRWAEKHTREISTPTAVTLQFFVAVYGGYFGAGMGIMMLAVFTLFMEGTIHEINAVKTWLGVIINLVASIVFFSKGLVVIEPAIALTIGSLIGGFYAAKLSLRVNPEKLRLVIAIYGLLMSVYFAKQKWLG